MPPGRRHATPIMAMGKLTNELRTFTPILFHGRALKYFSADQGMMKRRPDSGKSLKIFIIIQPLIMRPQGTFLLSVIKTSFSFILFPPLFDLFAVLLKIFQQGSIFCVLPDGDNHLPAQPTPFRNRKFSAEPRPVLTAITQILLVPVIIVKFAGALPNTPAQRRQRPSENGFAGIRNRISRSEIERECGDGYHMRDR